MKEREAIGGRTREKEESEPVEDVYKWVEAYRWKAPIRPMGVVPSGST